MQTYKDINYAVIRRKRRSSSLIVENDGTIKLIVPLDTSNEDVEKIIESKRYWIYTKKAELESLNYSKIDRKFVSGQGFMYLGSSYRLEIVDTLDVDLKLYRGRFYLKKSKLENAAEVFKSFYREKGLKKIEERINLYKDMIGVEPNKVRVMELQNRWASCTNKGNLNFNFKCIMAPLSIVDYIVVHELVHIKYKNHDSAFWNAIDKVMPDYEKRKEWLKNNGAALDI
ncbi:M48 family metallopeptidase [Terrisporobacter hibernicus]|uniref:M48 family metallopeptidase n=1 Tax=Terrisporobacter hibernicus TaxID=2813371 RepID=A0AAX2ZFT7_9FIRM|nr:SprT family zinc-dependent metalloprotease [Terrisporobacter hibernicus]UEL47220.1 M48 family metallopeptidase [Terrisporobacter hibernicus]